MVAGLLPVGDDTCGIALRSSDICGNACSYGWTRAARDDQPCGSGAMWPHSVSIAHGIQRMDTNHSDSGGLLMRNKFDDLMTTL